METARLVPERTALIVIDLQKSVVQRTLAPHTAAAVVERATRLIQRFRAMSAFVVLVRADYLGMRDILNPLTDQMAPIPPRPADSSTLAPELAQTATDFVLTKRQWGAFHATELDSVLRRRGIDTLVLCGIATGIGVDTTAREAYQLGYDQVFAVDAMSGLSEREHEYVTEYIFPKIGRVRLTEEILSGMF
jgi:nicotinamidase-related amidase